MFESNRRRVQNLTGLEIWFFIVGRVLVAFGVGAVTMAYFPAFASAVAWPAIIGGGVLFLVASRGLFRVRPDGEAS